MGVTARPRKIVYVTAGLRGGGAEAMLTRLATAKPAVADEITVVSLLPAEAHVGRLRAAGVTVVELQFDRAGGVAWGLVKLAKLIAERRPDIVQGWMYHGDLAALVALIMSGRRKQTRLVWSIRCSDMDLRRYGLGLRAVVKACTLLSGWPDLVTANSAAGLKFHLALGYRPRRAEVVANGIDVDEFRPDAAARRAMRVELGIPENAIVLAHVARVDPMKDHATFLAAMAQLPDVSALLVGAGTENLPAAAQPRPTRPPFRCRAPVHGRRFRGVELALRRGLLERARRRNGLRSTRRRDRRGRRQAHRRRHRSRRAAWRPRCARLRHPDTGGQIGGGRAERGRRARTRIVEHFALAGAVRRHAELYASLTRSLGGGDASGR